MIKNINKANELIKQTEKEALEIIKKREFIKTMSNFYGDLEAVVGD